ncbi:Nonribosomal peptide synthase chyA [Colletotrichum sp. SAR11_239]|nr:Nonribosomal peptide synthase chyA [Colletotrichum sp. SAR11_239]
MASDFAKTSLPGGVVNDVLGFCARQNVSEETFFIAAWSYTIAIYNAASLVTTSVIRDGKKNKVTIEFDSRMTILEACSALHYTKICSGTDSEPSTRSSTPGGELHDDPTTILFAQNGTLDLDSDIGKQGILPNIVIDVQYRIALHYFPHSVSALSAHAFLETFTTIIRQFATLPHDTLLSEVNVLGPLNRETLESWSPSCVSAVESCVHDYVDEHASNTPWKEAVIATEGPSFTYSQLSTLSNRLAKYLINNGINKEDIVPILFEKSSFAVLAIVAILKAGGAYVGFSAETPINFLRECSSIANAPLIITSNQHEDLARKVNSRALVLDQAFVDGLESSTDDEGFSSPARPSDLAYLVFTSGSTGTPKAVMTEHRAYVTDALAQQKAALLTPSSRVLHFASYNFDATNFDVLTTLIAGGTICVPTEFDRINRLAGAINDLGANFLGVTATLAQVLDPEDVSGLKTVILCGEANSPEIVEKWTRSGADVINGYGPSEASCAFSYNIYTRQSPRANNIGRCNGKDAAPLDIVNDIKSELIDVQSIKKKLANDLKAIAIPQAFIPLLRMPVTSQGKLDRKRLKKIGSQLDKLRLAAFSGVTVSVKDEPAMNEFEAIVCELFARSLNLSKGEIGRQSDFFSIGGDSLKAIKLVSLARKLGFSLSVPDILQNPRLFQLAEFLCKSAETNDSMSSYQPFSNIANQITLGEIQESARKASASHEIEDMVQATDLQASCVAFSTFSEERRGINWLICDFDEPRDETAVHPFELLSSHDATKIQRLLIRISAAQYDGHSVSILSREMRSLLNGCQLPELKGSYQSYLHYARTNELDEGIEYWRSLLHGAEMTQLVNQKGSSHGVPSGLNFVDGVLVSMIDSQLLESCRIGDTSSNTFGGNTKGAIVKTAWALTLSELTGKDDVVFGSTGWGRNHSVEFAEDVMGSCTSHIPTRLRITTSATGNNPRAIYGDLVEQIQTQHIASMRYENIGANTIVEKCTAWERWTRFSSLLVFQGLDIGTPQNCSEDGGVAPTMRFTEIMDPGDRADVIVHVEPFGDQTRVMMAFAKARLPEDIAGVMMSTFKGYLKLITQFPDQPVPLDKRDLSPLLPTICASAAIRRTPDVVINSRAKDTVKEIWMKVLDVDDGEFGMMREGSRSFLEIWGNSVSAAALAHEYRSRGFAVSTEDMLRHQMAFEQMQMISMMIDGKQQ